MKVKQGSVAPLVAHYERVPELERGFVRGNIDPERTALNYNLRPCDVADVVQGAIAAHEETAGRMIRKDANVLMDWVVTMPADCPPERSREFFESVTSFIEGRYGYANVLGAYVHMDETTPHVHIPVLPFREGKLQASKVVNRADLQTFHADLGEHVDRDLGIHVSIELDETAHLQKAMAHSELTMKEFKKAKDAAKVEITAEVERAERRLECLQRRIEELEPASETLAESVRTLYKARNDGEREKGLAGEIEGLRGRIEGAEVELGVCRGQIADCRERERDARARADELRGRVEPLRGRVEAARAAFEQLREKFESVRGFAHNMGERAAVLLRSLGVQAFAGNPAPGFQRPRAVKAASQSVTFDRPKRSGGRVTLDDETRRARSAADAYNSRHPMRGREQGRDR